MKKVLMLDLDDVICEGGFQYLVNKFTKQNYTLEDFKNYKMQDMIPENQKKEWVEFFSKNNMYDKASFIENAYDSIKILNEKYNVYILSAYLLDEGPHVTGGILNNKYNWLIENLPFIPPQNLVFANDKSIIKCDIRIDDKFSNLFGEAETKILFTAYHNKKLTNEDLEVHGAIRANDWNEVLNILM